MVQFIDTISGHVALAMFFICGAIAMWWLGFPGPSEVPFGMWTLGIGIVGRATQKVNDGK